MGEARGDSTTVDKVLTKFALVVLELPFHMEKVGMMSLLVSWSPGLLESRPPGSPGPLTGVGRSCPSRLMGMSPALALASPSLLADPASLH